MNDPPAGDARPRDPVPPAPVTAGLTAEQATAVTFGRGPLLLVAGPGTGKTRTLTHRVAYLLASGRAAPRQILAVTFSVRAAGELRLRLADLLGPERAAGVTAATFHAVCARLLREHAAVFNRSARFSIYDQADVRRVIERLLADPAQDAIRAAIANGGRAGAGELERVIGEAKARLQEPDALESPLAGPCGPLAAAVWRATDAELARCNAFAFDDLLACAARLLTEHPDRLAHLRRRWRWLVVDELQDVNAAQAALVDRLAGPTGNLTAVGDDDQLIYRFRCADPEAILGFGARHPGHRSIVLARNFRSRAEILDAAGACVAHNPRRTEKALVADRGAGGRVRVREFANEHAEAHAIAHVIADALGEGLAPTEVLVLARTGHAVAALVHRLAAAGIPHRVLGSLGLYERAEVRDALAYLGLLANPADAQAFLRAVAAPRRGIGHAGAERVIAHAREHHRGDLIAASADADEITGLRGAAARAALTGFGAGLETVRAEHAAGRSLGTLVTATVTLPGGLVAAAQRRRERASSAWARRDADRILEDLRSLCRAARAFDDEDSGERGLRGFLEHAAGLHAHELPDGSDPRVTLSTIHRAKGTEATLVILLACEERLLPSWRALETTDPEALAEERRLFYVAATRARDRLLITHAVQRGGRATSGPSRFLSEAGLLDTARALAA
ncbi:MAG: ATP-dependent helicase UvrD/PcrA [Solirubrobacteraceae bacterium]|jgi:DNA helicase-2/ATP-dependent DNA helicase PcrA|nr:ATP-dependent helicase UvrD/PcrA [Solirubrobacteraceae bacterium]